VNALKRLRAHLGVDDLDLRGRCAAADQQHLVEGTVKFSDVMRLLLVYGCDMGAEQRPPRAVMQSIIRRLTALSDAEKRDTPEPAAISKQPRWMDRRDKNPPRVDFEDDRWVPRPRIPNPRPRNLNSEP